MDNDVKHTADLYRLAAWAHARRKQLIWISAAVIVVGAIAGIYTWRKTYNETLAAESLSKLKMPAPSETLTANAAEPFVKLANDFQGTSAAGRALLVAGGMLFEAGKFKEAQDQFDRFMRDHSDSPLAIQALMGIAATLEAQGKTGDAATRYDDIVRHHGEDAVGPQAKSALARLYVGQNKPAEALRLYQDLAQKGNQDSWSAEAGIQAEELLMKYPNLRPKTAAPATHPAGSAPVTAPTSVIPKK